ncbi:MAG: hypothetical protein LIO90_06750 [Bacteroidales bacterium]|nr:hypothetical protein [Bacteroidales bacterium]
MLSLQDILRREEELKVYDYKVDGLPLWMWYRTRLRQKLRDHAQNAHVVRKGDSKKRKVAILARQLSRSIKNLWSIFTGHIHVDTLFLAYPRLQKINEHYIDKFTDPIIDHEETRGTSAIIQFSFMTDYAGRRMHDEKTYCIEALFPAISALSWVALPFHRFTGSYMTIERLGDAIQSDFLLTNRERLWLHQQYLFNKYKIKAWRRIFRKIKPGKVVFVVRSVNYAQIVAAQQIGLPIYELQHGVTFGDTMLYGGRVVNEFCPDQFLSFGEIWRGPQFGISVDKIKNIGWAYREMIDKMQPIEPRKNTVLLISSPYISRQILEIALELGQCYSDYTFHIRCHPMERYTPEMMERISVAPNVRLADNKIESSIALREYTHALGENSSVVYEAQSLGLKVGRLEYKGIKISSAGSLDKDSFYTLRGPEDFKGFMAWKGSDGTAETYSHYRPDAFNGLKTKNWKR